jgi:glutamyl-tRNA synthetase
VIFNWLFARHHHGKFLLRIEDTDLGRSKPEHTTAIYSALDWMGITWDEPVVIQSERTALYQQYLVQLLAEQKAYYCDCPAELDLATSTDYKIYDRVCRNKNLTSGAIRFKLPISGVDLKNQANNLVSASANNLTSINFTDLVYGPISFDLNQLDDFIIARADGTPMYNFAVVIDDHEMAISHIIRGEEHLSNTPKQILLYQAFNFKLPEFAHLPLILGRDGRKLSKREAAVAVEDYRIKGYLADALFNYLVRLGWSHGDQEIFTKLELIEFFDLDHIGKSGSIFDLDKLSWVNTVYLKNSSAQQLLDLIIRDLDPVYLTKFKLLQENQILALLELYKTRVKVLTELAEIILTLDQVPVSYDPVELAKWFTLDIIAGTNSSNNLNNLSSPKTSNANFNIKIQLAQLILNWETLAEWSAPEILTSIKQLCTQADLKLPDLAHPIRLALLGQTASPSIAELLAIFPKTEVIARIQKLIK